MLQKNRGSIFCSKELIKLLRLIKSKHGKNSQEYDAILCRNLFSFNGIVFGFVVVVVLLKY